MARTVVIALVMAVVGLVLLFNGALGLTISGWGDAEAIFGLFLSGLVTNTSAIAYVQLQSQGA